MEARALAFLFFSLLVLGCSDVDTGPGLPVLEPKGPRLVVASSDYRSGRLYVIELSTREILPTVFQIHSDPFIRVLPGEKNYFVVGRMGADYVWPIPVNLSRRTAQISTGASSNPQDVLKLGRFAYVSMLDEDRIAIFDLTAGAFTGNVVMNAHADADGRSEYAHLTEWNGKALVAIQRLDRARRMAPTTHSEIAVIDPATHREVRAQNTLRTNPVSPFKRGPDGDLYLAEAGRRFEFVVNNGGIERLDKTTLASKGLVLAETAIPGDLIDFEIVSPTLGVVLALVAPGNNTLYRFNPTTGVRGTVVLSGNADHLHQIVMNKAGTVAYVADRNPARPGVHVFSVPDFIERDFIALGLEPYWLELHE